jgi:hypothetical protein
MAELKTKQTEASVEKFIAGVSDKGRRDDAKSLVSFLRKITKAKPKMWGSSIIGFGARRLIYDSGRELDWFIVGFSPRKANTVLYYGKYPKFEDDLKKLGKHRTGGGCLYINKLEDIDLKVLKTMVEHSMKGK